MENRTTVKKLIQRLDNSLSHREVPFEERAQLLGLSTLSYELFLSGDIRKISNEKITEYEKFLKDI